MDVIASQISLTSRSESLPQASSCFAISRPRSAALPFTSQNKSLFQCSRPKSTESSYLNLHHDSSCHYISNSNENVNGVCGDSALLLPNFTDTSSKLLMYMLKESNTNMVNGYGFSLENNANDLLKFETSNPNVEQSPSEVLTSNSLPSNYQNNIFTERFLKNNYITEEKKENSEILVMEKKAIEDSQEALVKFSECEPNTPANDYNPPEQCFHLSFVEERKKLYDISKPDKKFFPKLQDCRRHSENTSSLDRKKLSTNLKLINRGQKVFKNNFFENVNGDEILKISNYNERFLNEKTDRVEVHYSSNEGTIKNENGSEKVTVPSNFHLVQQPVSVTEILTLEDKNSEKDDPRDCTYNNDFSKSTQVGPQELQNNPKLICRHGSDSTYDEIIELLQTLEEENTDSHNLGREMNSGENNSSAQENSKDTISNFNDVFAYLEEIEKDDTLCKSAEDKFSKGFTSPSLEKLLNKTSVELAHEVLSLEIQIEDQKKGIKILKDTMTDMKKAKKIAEREHQEILRKTNSDAEALVKRHQKFIRQLLNEKKNLSETISKLVQDLRVSEEKYKFNIKIMEEKHLTEIKKTKDAQAAVDKIKREKWMEMKTQKIKEMTVKGLEPELSRMAAQQQQELTELRNLHRAEIEAIELRAARRTSELMDQLRIELTKEKENAITLQLNSLRASMERELEEERNKFHQNCQNQKQHIRKLEMKLSSQEREFSLNLIETKQEIEKEKHKLLRTHQENLDEIKRRHSVELSNLCEALETEKQNSLKNLEKQLAVKFSEREAELRELYKKERNREIEMVIEKLEKEQAKTQAELETALENKIKKVKEKLEAEINELESNVADLKEKLSCAKSEISEKEEFITKLKSEIRQLQTEISFLRKSCEEMICERTQLKEIIRSEFEDNTKDLLRVNKNLEKEILDLKEIHLKELAKKDELNLQIKNEMQKELTHVYSRIKAAVGKKEKVIETLREENKAINEQYRQLELMLDRQRRNLLLQ